MGIFMVIIKSFGSIFVLFFLTKMLGKKQLGQLNMFDYVIGISIGNVVAEMSVNSEVSYLDGVVTMAVYAFVAVLVTYITTKSILLRRFIAGSPVIIMEDGVILQEGLKKAKIDLCDLLEEARNNGYFDISEIEYAIMEANGKISFLPKSAYQMVTPHDLKIKKSYESLCPNLILDGKIMTENLKYIKKDTKWLVSRLSKMGYTDIDELLLVISDAEEKLTVYKKNVKKKREDCLE